MTQRHIRQVFAPFEGGIATIGSSNKVQATSSSPLDHARAFLGSPLVKAKLVFILFQCCAVAMGVWKLQGMGLLPTAHSDWLAWVPAKVYRETALL